MNLRPKRAKEVFIKDTGSATLSIDRLFTKNWNLEDIHEKTLKKSQIPMCIFVGFEICS